MTRGGVNFVLQWGASTAVSYVLTSSCLVPTPGAVVFTFQVTPSNRRGGLPGGVSRAALFFHNWSRGFSSKTLSSRSYKKWVTLRCVSFQPRWAEKVFLNGCSIHGHTREIRYLTRQQPNNVFGGTTLTLRGTYTWKNPWWLLLWAEAQLNRQRYV